MRLIDVDDLHITVSGGRHNTKRIISDVLERIFKEAPTVEAIPIEWIKERMSNIEDTMLETAWSMLISDWEKRREE